MGTAFILLNVGIMTSAQGDFETARSQISTSLQIFQTMGEQATYAEGLLHLGGVELLQGDHSAARQRAKESLAILRQLGSNTFIVLVLVQLEWIAAFLEGDVAAAQAALEEGLALAREIDNSVLAAQAIIGQGHLALESGDNASALDKYRAALNDLRGKDAATMVIPTGLLGMLAVAAARADFGLAARLAAFSIGLRDSQAYQWNPLDQRLYERSVSTTRAGMNDDDFSVAWAAGRALSLDDAVGLALRE
jgi:ATP/maltotriose-dependent transcriptional regulator MalT